MKRETDVRTDRNTALHIREALSLQALYGFDFAREHLLAQGIEQQLALRMLAIRYERRSSAANCLEGGV
jgi:hypothetical protein